MHSRILIGIAALLAAPLTASAQNGPPPFAASQFVGEIEIVIADDPANDRSETRHYLRDAVTGSVRRLRFDGGDAPAIKPGSRVRVNGRAEGDEILLAANGVETLDDGVTTESLAAAGAQSTLVMVGDFTDAGVSCSISDIDARMFGSGGGTSVTTLFEAMSEGQISFTGRTEGPFAINHSSSSCEPYAWADDLDAAATSAGIDLSQYSRKVYVVPRQNGCGYAGLGTLGGTNANTRAWVLRCDLPDVFAHEVGHNVGFHHASTLSSEYGDRSSIMGIAGVGMRHTASPHAETIGWLAGAERQHVTASGSHALSPFYVGGTSPRVLTIDKPDTGDVYYLSYRLGVGADSGLPSSYRNRLTVHRHNGQNPTAKTYLMGTYAPGESFVDDANGIRVTLDSLNSTSASVSVDLGTECAAQAPQVNITPAEQSGAPGTELVYDVSVTNADGAGCPTREFVASAVVPDASWSAFVSPASVNLAAGDSTTLSLSAVSPSSASGSNSIGVDVSNGVGTTRDSATYRVDAGCVVNAPTVTLQPSSRDGAPGDALSYSLTVRNNDSSACADSGFNLSASVPAAGWAADVQSGSLTVAAGGEASTTVSLSVAADATTGSYRSTISASRPEDTREVVATANITASSAPDTEAPSAPTGLAASAKRKQINLSWQAASDNVGVTGYVIRRDGQVLAEVASPGYNDRSVSRGVTYRYEVLARDAAGNLSPPSNSASAAMGGGGNRGKKSR